MIDHDDPYAEAIVDVVIVGAGGFGREVEQWIADLNIGLPVYRVLGFVDDHQTGPRILGTVDWLRERPGVAAVLGVGDPRAKRELVDRLASERWWPRIVHPSAKLGRGVTLGEGAIVCPDVTITVDVAIGRWSLLNLDCTVGHDAQVGDYATIAPGVHVSGGAAIGEGADVGTGVVIRPRSRIGAWSTVGCGAVVIQDVPERVTAIGAPARAR